jgi:hypothetical protein
MRVAAVRNAGRRGPPQGLVARGHRAGAPAIPAPNGGWNARDALSAMPPNDALVLDNFIPDAIGVRLRSGYEEHATGLNNYVLTLMQYSGPTADELFAATADKVYDVTAAGAAVEVLSGKTNGEWQHTMFATTGGNYLIACNGEDTAQTYDGSSWADLAVNNVSEAVLIGVTAHKSRLWFIEKESLSAWHLGVAAIAGDATEFPVGPLCKLGGYLLAVASWSRDGGSGLDDYLVFITNKGEALVYQGTDPTNASTWALVGVFRVPEPIGRRCVVGLGGDLGVLTSQGLLPFSGILALSSAGSAKLAATDKISKAFDEAYEGSSTHFGWQVIEYPHERLLIINVPIVENSGVHQYVMNTQNGSWCRWRAINANCWGMLGDDMYFGGDEVVYKMDGSRFNDDGVEIDALSISAFNNLGGNNNKAVTQVRPMFTAAAGYSPSIGLRVDYSNGPYTLTASASETGGSAWGEAEWGVAEWATGIINQAKWRSVSGFGSTFSFVLSVSTQEQFRFDSVDLMIDAAGYV